MTSNRCCWDKCTRRAKVLPLVVIEEPQRRHGGTGFIIAIPHCGPCFDSQTIDELMTPEAFQQLIDRAQPDCPYELSRANAVLRSTPFCRDAGAGNQKIQIPRTH